MLGKRREVFKTLVALMPFANCADLSFETLTRILHFYVSHFPEN